MAIVKVLGLYQGFPNYGTRTIYFWFGIGLPLIPIFYYYTNPENEVNSLLLFMYLPFFLIQSFFIVRYISKIGKQWPINEYEKLTPDQVTFPFIFAIGIYGLFHFTLFLLINGFLKTNWTGEL